MNLTQKKSLNDNNIIIYLILIPFLQPKGFNTYFPLYKSFFTAWLYISVFLIFISLIPIILKGKISCKKCIMPVCIYYLAMITITFFAQDGFNSGLQQMFAAPALYLYCLICLREKSVQFANCVANILIINTLLNITVFSPWLFSDYFAPSLQTNHGMFLGHVQTGAQVGILGMFVSYLLYSVMPKYKHKAYLLAILSLATMIMSYTYASFFTIFIFVIGLIVNRFSRMNRKKGAFAKDSRIFFFGYLVINFLLIIILPRYNWELSFLGIDLHGRGLIWRAALQAFEKHKLFGYGTIGTEIYWRTWDVNAVGLDYMHNEIIQTLITGGIVLTILFIIMFFSFTNETRKIGNISLLKFANVCLCAFLFVMTFESTSWYFYMHIFFSLFACLPEISKHVHVKKLVDREYAMSRKRRGMVV